MITDWDILNIIKQRIVEEINTYIDNPEVVADVGEQDVFFEYPDIDRAGKLSFWINYSYANQEQITWQSDDATLELEIYVLCKGRSRSELIEQCFAYKSALERMIAADRNLRGLADTCTVNSSNWYSQVEGSPTATGFRINATVKWQKTYNSNIGG